MKWGLFTYSNSYWKHTYILEKILTMKILILYKNNIIENSGAV